MRAERGADAERKKQALLVELETARVDRKADLVLLHESLLFLAAYPDSASIARAAEAGLAGFGGRVARLGARAKEALDESGIANTAIHTSLALPVVRAFAARDPGALTVFVEGEGVEEKVEIALRELLQPAELEAFLDGYTSMGDMLGGDHHVERLLAWLDARIAGEGERRIAWSMLDLPICWTLGHGDGSRTLARAPRTRRMLQRRAFDKRPVSLIREVKKGGFAAVRQRASAAEAWIHAARAAVTARLREMYTFVYAGADDVVSADLGVAEIGVIGVLPNERLPLRTFYGYLLSRNGVPIGYGDFVLAFEWGELNFHIFESFRGAESQRIYGALARFAYHHFGLRYLFLNRYQFGHHNEEAIHTGAFWFYEKLGFRPTAEARAIWARERALIDRDPEHRTSAPDLRRLAKSHMGLGLAEGAEARYGGFHPIQVARTVMRRVDEEHGGDRRRALAAARRRLGAVVGPRRAEQAERTGLSLVLDLLPDLEDWGRKDRAELARVIEAKAHVDGRRFLAATQSARRFGEAIIRIGSTGLDGTNG